MRTAVLVTCRLVWRRCFVVFAIEFTAFPIYPKHTVAWAQSTNRALVEAHALVEACMWVGIVLVFVLLWFATRPSTHLRGLRVFAVVWAELDVCRF